MMMAVEDDPAETPPIAELDESSPSSVTAYEKKCVVVVSILDDGGTIRILGVVDIGAMKALTAPRPDRKSVV